MTIQNTELRYYPDTMICGCATAFKLVQGILAVLRGEKKALIDIEALLSKVSVPVVGWEKWLLDMISSASRMSAATRPSFSVLSISEIGEPPDAENVLPVLIVNGSTWLSGTFLICEVNVPADREISNRTLVIRREEIIDAARCQPKTEFERIQPKRGLNQNKVGGTGGTQ